MGKSPLSTTRLAAANSETCMVQERLKQFAGNSSVMAGRGVLCKLPGNRYSAQ
jgi:hypothetical protein